MVTRRIRKHRFSRVVAVALVFLFQFAYLSPSLASSLAHARRHSRRSPTHQLANSPLTPPLRVLRLSEMKKITGAGDYRDKNRCGQLPWWRFYKGVNVVNGNLYRSSTDLSYPSRAMNVAFTRVYNSNEDAVGPFGKGWQFSYDIVLYTDPQDPVGTLDRQTWNGAQLPYQVDADGLVTAPVYVHDKTAKTKALAKIALEGGGTEEVQMTFDLEGNRTDNNPLPAGETDEFILEFTRAAKDGSKTTYYAFGKDPDGNPTGYYKATLIEDRNGNAMTFQYGLSVTYPDGSTDKLLTKVTDTVGRETTITWENLNPTGPPAWRVVEIKDPLTPPRTWRYYYNADNNLWKVTDPADRTVTYTYTSVTGPLGTEDGLLASESSMMGRTRSYTYKIDTTYAVPRLSVDQVTEPGGYQWYVYYPAAGRTHILPVVALTGPTSRFDYDEYGRILVYHANKSDTAGLRRWEWNNAFSLMNYFDGYAASRKTEMVYDTVFDGEGNVVEPGQGNVLTSSVYEGETPHTTSMTYYNESKYHQMAMATDPLGNSTLQDYFASDDLTPGNRGNLKSVQDASGNETTFTYNEYGQKVTMRDAELRTWRYDYNAQGDLEKLTYPDSSFTQTTYDTIGRPTEVRDRRTQITTIQYNEVGQPTQIHYEADNTTVTYFYDNDGQMTSVTDSRGTTGYVYEGSTGRLLSITDPVVGMVSYEYDSYGSRTKMTLPNGKEVTYGYDYSQIVTLAYQSPSLYTSGAGDVEANVVPVIREITDPWGYKTRCYYFDSGETKLVDAAIAKDAGGNDVLAVGLWKLRDAKARLQRVKVVYGAPGSFELDDFEPGGTFLLGYDYDYNALDNRLHLYEIDANNTRTATETYGYDQLSRLTSVTYKDNVTQTYEFDKVGNRLTKMEGATTTNYTYNNVNEMVTAGSDSYTYDQNGNTLSGGGRDYGWDQQNRLKAVTKDGTTVRFTYRADGLRARKEVVGGLTIDYVYDGQTVIREKRSDGKSVWYTPGPNGYISRTVVNDATGQVLDKEWFVYDGLGSCRAMVKPNADGTQAVLTARMDYDVYGKVRTQSGSTESKFKYVAGIGHPTDEETGLIYMRAKVL